MPPPPPPRQSCMEAERAYRTESATVRRFELYKTYLEAHQTELRGVVLSDIKDVVLQVWMGLWVGVSWLVL